ncbi:MAG: ABC transporter ATP-binding protein [Proteobacteria bacterium]|nr:ABC transporter ATP-binding protein [Pseudomonadota bacterium]
MFSIFERWVNPFPAAVPALPRKFLTFLWICSRGMRRYIAAMMLLTAVFGAFEAWLFSALGQVVDWLAKIPPQELWARERGHLLLLAGILTASIALAAGQSLIKQQTLAANFAMRLRWIFHRNMLAQSLSFYQDEFAGRVATKVMQTALAVRDTWMIVTDILVYLVIYFVTIGLVVGGFNPLLLAPFSIWLAVYLLFIRFFVPRLAKLGKAQADARSLMTGRITDAYTNITTVKLFSHSNRESAYAQGAMVEFLRTVYRQMRMVTSFEVINQLLTVFMIGSMGGMTLWMWSHGQLGVGAVAAAIAMAMRLSGISHWMMWEMSNLFEQVGVVQDGLNTLSHSPSVVDVPDAKPLVATRGDIRFEHVDFSYGAQSEDKRVIRGLNLHIRPGEKIGLVGRSGAGKSTLVNLLLRFYDVPAGRILIDGVDIATVTQESLRSQIGMVTQDTSLLHRSVRENILYGRPDATETQMLAAARRAEAMDFILGLSDPDGRTGFDARVGERGVKLSGGQRQRIAIARVMLKDAPILLLDEATSALDSEVEAAIQQSLYRLMEGKTVIAIAHRLSTIAAMDRLIVIEKGRVVEEGSHEALLARNGLYARLWAHQSGGFLGQSAHPAVPAAVELSEE